MGWCFRNNPRSIIDTRASPDHTHFTPFQIELCISCEPMRILVAEDDAPLADFLHQRLLQEQFAVQMVSTGVEAQRMAAEQPYDVVLLDLSMPGATDLDVLRGIRSKKPDLPVLIVTGASLVEERVRGLDA